MEMIAQQSTLNINEILHPGSRNSQYQAVLERSILQTVAYADIFEYPLTPEEIHRHLVQIPATLEEVQQALRSPGWAADYLSEINGFITLPGREDLILTRQRRALAAAELWPKAIRYGQWIAHLPFVRMVAVTGALTMDNVEKGADIDYLVVNETGRLWLCRALVILLVRWAALLGDTVCPNYFLSLNALVYPQRNLYTAHEMIQMVPLSGWDIYCQMRLLNLWTLEYLPNSTIPQKLTEIGINQPKGKDLRSPVETLLRMPVGDWIERLEMKRKIRKFGKNSQGSSEATFCADWCKGHFNGHEKRSLTAFSERWQMIGATLEKRTYSTGTVDGCNHPG